MDMTSVLNQQQLEKFKHFSDLLISENKKYNLTAITDPAEIRQKHFADSLIALDILNEYSNTLTENPKLIDIGSGAGFPSVPLAIALPDWQIFSVDGTGKKANFQKMVKKELNLQNLSVINDRSENLAHNSEYYNEFDIATSRALAHLSIVAELCIPFLKINGQMLAWKGPKVTEELQAADLASEILGANTPQIILTADTTRLISITKIRSTPKIYPRQYKNIKSSPLGIK